MFFCCARASSGKRRGIYPCTVCQNCRLRRNRKIGHLSKRTTREKLLSHLSEQAALQGSEHFLIPFDQQQLADYLCVERSGLSVALNRLQFFLCGPLEDRAGRGER
ncbi:hypothetical protein [Bittarella massiliensis (ex Durand et al. 2017)]|uniref:hypothetical protein n=1 Tax=Bittarella massiliensis (ex Durand et al. 2017) TaxID=1720313 RepID=UPI001AA16B6A